MNEESRQTIIASILGSISLMPLLILPTLVGALIDDAGFSESQAGWVAAAGFAGGAIAAVYSGLRIQHLDPRRLAVTGLVLLAVFDGLSFWVAQVPTWLFVVFRFASGFGGAIAYAAVMATIASTAHQERGYGIFMVFQFGVSGIGLYGLPYLLPFTGVSGLFLLLALLAVAALALRRSVLSRPATPGTSAVEIHMLLKPASVLVMLGIGLYETANLMHYAYDERIGLQFGLTDYRIGEILGVATFLGVPSALIVVGIGERFGQLKPLALALLASIIGLGILLYPIGEASYTVSMYTMGAAWAFGLPFFYAIAARLDPGGSVVVVCGFFTSGGATLGPALAAMLVKPGNYDDVLLVAIGLYGVVAALMAICVSMAERDQD